jgi:hypothetical protein
VTELHRFRADSVPSGGARANRAYLRPMRLLATLVALLLVPADLGHAGWRPPVPGAVSRPFDLGADPFEAGRHRGVDRAAPPGAVVRAPCAGPVAFAGRIGAAGRVVTLRCGPWRVTHLPLASITVRAGAAVAPGAPLGTVAAAREHAGLHLGVRREGTRFGYADPLRFLGRGHAPPAPPLGRAPRPGRPAPPTRPAPRPPRPPRPVVARRPVLVPRPFVAPRPVAAPAGSSRGPRAPFAPWPAWVGLALALAGAGLRLRGRARTARAGAGSRYVGAVTGGAERTGGKPCRS